MSGEPLPPVTPEKYAEVVDGVVADLKEAWSTQHTDLTSVELLAATILAIMAPEMIRHTPGLAESLIVSYRGEIEAATGVDLPVAAPAPAPPQHRPEPSSAERPGFYM